MISGADPLKNYHMNYQRSTYYYQQSKLTSNSIADRKENTMYYIWELLYAGNTDKCIQELEFLLKENNMKLDRITNASIPFFELLALAYLRKGEQQNCLNNHNASSCIVPLYKPAQHKNKYGSTEAIKIYEKLLKYNPTDYQSRWLFNLAHMTLGSYPDGVKKEHLIPGYDYYGDRQFEDIATQNNVGLWSLSGGCCTDDFNNDGKIDIITSGYGYNEFMHYYGNTGEGFIEKTDSFQLKGMLGGLNMIHADYDNDGFKDVLVLRGGWLGEGGKQQNSLLKNIEGKYFLDVTEKAGLKSYFPTQTAVWSDFNLDGNLDLFIGNEQYPCELYQNNGDGTFTNNTNGYGVKINAFVKAVNTGDVNNDGYPDIFISINGDNNVLLVNQTNTLGRISFSNETKNYSVELPKASFTTWFWDINNDGWDDLFVGNYNLSKQNYVAKFYAQEKITNQFNDENPRVYINSQKGFFIDKTSEFDMNKVLFIMGANYSDFDNDGNFDFYVGTGSPEYNAVIPNRAFTLHKEGRFTETTQQNGLGNIQKGHAISFADFDHDGDEDIYAVLGGAFEGDAYPNALFKNKLKNANNWIQLELKGTDKCNVSAIGAKIELTAIDYSGTTKRFYRTVSTGASFGSSALRLHIGLGRTEKIKELKVQWPTTNNLTTKYSNLELNSFYEIYQNIAEVRKIDLPKIHFQKLNSNKHSHHTH